MKKTTLVTTLTLLSMIAGASTSLAAEQNYQSNGEIEFTPYTGITSPVDPDNPIDGVTPIDPTNPDGKPNPGTAGPLSIDYASSFVFGANEITNVDMTYYADSLQLSDGTERSNYVQISDHRGTNAGWTMTVSQTGGQFSSDATLNSELTGSVLKFTAGTPNSIYADVKAPETQEVVLNPNGDASTVMTAAEGSGAGTWTNQFGAIEDVSVGEETVTKNTGVSLFVPGSTPKDAVKYGTELTWTLSDVPLM